MQYERTHDWQTEIARIDPELRDSLAGTMSHVLMRESEIPRRYKELILMACAATMRYGSSIRRHGEEAMYFGATDGEIVEALALASLSSGIPALIEGIEAIGHRLGSSMRPPGSAPIKTTAAAQ